MTDFERLVAQVAKHEGFRSLVYDDATGKPIVPGSHVIGHPTIGYGWALDRDPFSEPDGRRRLIDRLDQRLFDLRHRIVWFGELDPVRQMALIELAYNLGVDGLLGFPKMLAAVKRRRWAEAKAELLDSKWAREDVGPERREALAFMLETGEWPVAA